MDDIEEEECRESNVEDQDKTNRTWWRNEIELPKYAANYVRGICKPYLHREREACWKEYLKISRSRFHQKDFEDWGNSSSFAPGNMAPFVYDELTSVVHTEYRVAKDYAITSRIIRDCHFDASFKPYRLLDIGSGSGSASISALDAFPSIGEETIVDSSEYMQHIASGLIHEQRAFYEKPFVAVTTNNNLIDLLEEHGSGYDLILMNRFLSELPTNKGRASASVIAWELLRPGGVLLCSEEGDRWGFHLVRCLRSLYRNMLPPTGQSELQILAPCAHLHECPLLNNKTQWCHFAQQCPPGPTAAYQARRKAAELFSYVALRKASDSELGKPYKSRVLSTPLKRDKHCILNLCSTEGRVEQRVYSKKKVGNAETYRLIHILSCYLSRIPNNYEKQNGEEALMIRRIQIQKTSFRLFPYKTTYILFP